jgi:hypothetical protein
VIRPSAKQGTRELQRQAADFVFEVPEEDEGETLQAMTVSHHAPVVTPAFESRLDCMDGRGQGLNQSVRSFFEPRLGYDLSSVRIHTDGWAHGMARDVQARAFTVGHHVVFGEGYYAPDTTEGRHLIAHELIHTIQQRAVSAKRTPAITTAPTSIGLATSRPGLLLQRAACNFFVFDNTEPTLGWVWKLGARGLASKAWGGYAVASGTSIEDMLYQVLSVYAQEDCDCIEEIQFLSHGSSGNAMSISSSGDELTINDFNIPGLEEFGDGPTGTDEYRAWSAKLTPRQRRLVLLRRVLCGPGAEVYYRSCEAFRGKGGKEFAKASAAFWRSKVIGHTKLIALTQPGKKVVKPGQEPYWDDSEGEGGTRPKKPGKSAGVKPKKD